MTDILIPVYADQDLTPRSVEVLRAIVDAAFPEHHIIFKTWNGSRVTGKVLVFGKGPEGGHNQAEFVYTYSVAQIMSKANAASVIKAALRQFIEEPEPVPFDKPISAPYAWYEEVDFDAPTVIDIETSGNLGKEDTPEDIGIISVGIYQPGSPPFVIEGAWFAGASQNLSYSDLEELREYLPRFTKAIYHNGKFDTRVLNRVLGVKLHVWFDTMLAHHVLNIAAGDHKLKTLARRYLGAPEWEADLSKYTKGGGYYELIPTDKLIEYNGWDVYWTYKLWEFLAPQIEADDANQRALMVEMAAAEFLLEVENYGIPFDSEYAESYGAELQEGMDRELASMRLLLGSETYNPNSPHQVKAVLGDYNITVPDTLADTLQEVLDSLNPGDSAARYLTSQLEYKKLAKIHGTYVKGWSNKVRNGRVRPTFLVHGTSTGRLSSTRVNSQNVPRDKAIRKLVKTHG
jgi:DNA polymerase I-like protein with 3'-5' exonuclease and polymerase domains